MKKVNKLFAGLVGIVATASMAYAAVSATAPELNAPMRAASEATTVSAYWSLGTDVDYSGAAASELVGADAIASTNLKISNLTKNRKRTCSEVNFTTYNPTASYSDESAALTFTLTPAEGVYFKPTEVEFKSVRCGTDGGAVSAKLIRGTQEILLVDKVTPNRNGNSASKPNPEGEPQWTRFSVSEPLAALAATNDPVVLKIFVTGTDREYGFAHIGIYGTTSTEGGETPVVPEIPEDCFAVPGALSLGSATADTRWSYNTDGHSKFGFESEAKGVGYVKNKAVATANVFVTEQGVYKVVWKWAKSSGGVCTVAVADADTGAVEAEKAWTVENGTSEFVLAGLVTEGRKTLSLSFAATHTSWVGNYFTPELVKIADSWAEVSSATIESLKAEVVEGYDWSYTAPFEFDAETVDLKLAYICGDVTVRVDDAEIQSADGVYPIPVPASNNETIVKVSLTPAEGAYAGQTEYTVRIFRLGDVMVNSVAVDGVSLPIVDALNEEAGSAVVSDRIYTAVPKLVATFADGSIVEGVPTVDGTSAVYTFTGVFGDRSKDYTVTVEGVHLYSAADTDKEVKVVYDSAYNGENKVWSNGLFSIYPTNDGWNNKQFKFSTDNNRTVHIDVPAYMLVKKLVLAQLKDNYQVGKITSVSSDGATVWMPTASEFAIGDGMEYDLVCVVENHTAGAGFDVTFEGDGQPTWWWEFAYEEVESTDLTNTDATLTAAGNNAVVCFGFDRPVNGVNDTNVLGYANGEATDGYSHGTSFVYFPLWELEYGTEYTVTIPKGYLADNNGVSNSEDISYTFTTAAEPEAVEPMADERFIVVGNVDELRAAVDGLSASNGSTDAERTVVYILNGDYDLGTIEGDSRYEVALAVKNVHNVSFIGESQDGVVLHGSREGITSPIVSGEGSTLYWQNLTISNDLTVEAVGVAYAGGKLDVMRGVTLKGFQDTYLSGVRGFYYDCTIYGKTDYVCGGGDHYFDSCHFVMTHAGGVITAPSTSEANVHGYVMMNCDITGEAGYNLARPWKNIPRNFWLNTTMHAVANPAGWQDMTPLETYLYEYGSVDGSGNPVDLSNRTCPSASVNQYTPILDAKYVPYFTSRNVLGYKDAFDAEAYKAEVAAPVNVNTYLDGNLCWDVLPGAIRYIVKHNGEYLCNLAGNFVSYEDLEAAIANKLSGTNALADDVNVRKGEYSVVALNALGQASEPSQPNSFIATGVDAVEVAGDADVEYYNMQGMRVENPSAGIYIRRSGNSVTKVVVK